MTHLKRALTALQTAVGMAVMCAGLAVLVVGAWVLPTVGEDEEG